MRLKRRVLKKHTMPELVLTPLIDTFATVLVMFMITAPMVQNSIKVDLPFGKSKEVSTAQEHIITLSKDGKVFFNNYPMNKKDIVAFVQKALVGKEDTPVFVKADRSISYGKVIEVVDKLKEAGVRYVAMSTQPI